MNSHQLQDARDVLSFMCSLIQEHPRKEYFSIWDSIKAIENREPELALGLAAEVHEEYIKEKVYKDDVQRDNARLKILSAAKALGILGIMGPDRVP